MRSAFTVALLLACSSVVQAEYAIVPLAEPVRDLAAVVAPPSAEEKLELPAGLLLLPLFEVNKNNPLAETTLFSVRNVSTTTAGQVGITYFTTAGLIQKETGHPLQPRQTLSINVNDVTGLEVNARGIARGFATIAIFQPKSPDGADKGIPPAPEPPALVGDYFQVIQNQDFATGGRLAILDSASVGDLCSLMEARFLNGGAFSGGTDLLFFVISPQGADPNTDPPTAVMNVFDEAGTLVETVNFFTSSVLTKLPVAAITATTFGTLDVAFSGTDGLVSVAHNALGRFSVGMNGACKDRYAGDF